jgi:predicted Fe-Mo cluster-binding NifX family protein
LIENMSGFVCPSCGTVTEVFGSGAGEAMARDFGVPLLARIPMDPRVRIACDEGVPFVTAGDMCPTATAFSDAASALVRLDRPQHAPVESEEDAAMSSESGMIRLAVPVADGQLCLHFGHCASFALVDADRATGEIHSREDVPAPDHQPGLLPRWLAERGVQVVIAGGMGQRAQQLFAEQGIQVVTGAVPTAPEDLAAAYLAGALRTGENVCDH